MELADSDRRLLGDHAAAADERRRELGAAVAERGPQWAVEALGRVPDDPITRAEWEQAAGWAAAHRELVAHTDPADPLGAAPPAGLAEKQASWLTAHAALGLRDGGGDEHELSDGALRMRVRAFDREQAWAPRYVGDELDATSRRAEQARADAQLWTARAAATNDAATAEQLRAAAAAAAAQAVELAERVTQLTEADTARGAWYANTAATRDADHRARGALAARGIDVDADEERVTAAEWLAAHRAEQAAEDPHREINHESQLTEPDEHGAAADAAAPGVDPAAGPPEPVAETDVHDIREVTQPDTAERTDPAQRHRVPTAEESAATVARAQTALAEITARRHADAAREAADRDQQRREELTRWAEHDQGAEQTTAHDTHADENDLALER